MIRVVHWVCTQDYARLDVEIGGERYGAQYRVPPGSYASLDSKWVKNFMKKQLLADIAHHISSTIEKGIDNYGK